MDLPLLSGALLLLACLRRHNPIGRFGGSGGVISSRRAPASALQVAAQGHRLAAPAGDRQRFPVLLGVAMQPALVALSTARLTCTGRCSEARAPAGAQTATAAKNVD